MKTKLKTKDKIILLISAVILIVAIASMFKYGPKVMSSMESGYDTGYEDGYAETYSRLCKNKTITVEGNWDDKEYYKGYMAGQLSGAAKCDAEKKAQNFRKETR